MTIETESFERTFDVEEPAELVLSNISGTVEIRAWDYPEIKVSGSKRLGGMLPWISPEEGFRATRIEMEQQGSRVIVRTTRQHEGFWGFVQWLGGVAHVDYAVRVPRRCNVVADLVSGRLRVEEIHGNVIVRTVSAGQTLRWLDGNLVVSTVSGGIDAENLGGKAAMRTVSGGVRARQCRFASLSGRTVSGNLELSTPLDPDGNYEFQSVSGGVRLVVPPDTRCSVELQSISGSVHSTLPGQVEELRRGQWRAEINGGGVRVRMQSVSGGLRIAEPAVVGAVADRAAEPSRSEPRPAGAEPAAEERADRESIMTMILEAVERGELSVDEAVVKLGELDALSHAEATEAKPPRPAEEPGPSEPAGGEQGSANGC